MHLFDDLFVRRHYIASVFLRLNQVERPNCPASLVSPSFSWPPIALDRGQAPNKVPLLSRSVLFVPAVCGMCGRRAAGSMNCAVQRQDGEAFVSVGLDPLELSGA
jgi:hypothetical protein